jgi:protein-tyrosine phosphatase
MRHLVSEAKLAERILIDSAGTGDWHIGEPPDERAQRAATS